MISWAVPDKNCRFKFEPPLNEFEELFSNLHEKALEALKKFQKITYCGKKEVKYN